MNRTEYIGKLNALYVGEKNCLEELITIYDEKDKEIERLKKRNKEIYEGFMATTKELTEYAEEVERLNNIIQKAIEYLESYNTDFKNCRFGEAPISIRELGDLLDILKGSDKE